MLAFDPGKIYLAYDLGNGFMLEDLTHKLGRRSRFRILSPSIWIVEQLDISARRSTKLVHVDLNVVQYAGLHGEKVCRAED